MTRALDTEGFDAWLDRRPEVCGDCGFYLADDGTCPECLIFWEER